ncbi:hypothetical protein [Mesorhizobium sp. ISC15]|uniref:hypothetical protein n=1 Tax=Mesorhizobium sp. ISC15 TaxID=3076429 RepID=UPI00301C6D98
MAATNSRKPRDSSPTTSVRLLSEIGTTNRKVAVEYVNPSITQALLQRGLDVIDAINIVEGARVIKSDDEISCIRWAWAVAEHGIARMQESVGPGVTEVQLWGYQPRKPGRLA